MKTKNLLSLFVLVILVSLTSKIFAQTNAVAWFNQGIKAQSPEEKIKNYLKAIELDPKFIHAYYNLGYAYKEIGDFANAEKALRQALVCDPSKLTKEDKLRISYELGLALRKLNRFQESVDALESAKKLTDNNVFLAAILYELGRTKVIMGQYDAAISVFAEGMALNSDKQSAFMAASREASKLKSLEEQYQQASALIDQNNMLQAEESLLKIVNIDPNYKDALKKLSEVRRLNSSQAKNNELDDSYNRALGFINSKDWKNAILTLERIVQVDSNYKDASSRLTFARSNLSRSLQSSEYEKLLEQGIADYNRGDWNQALVSFERVRAWDANFKNVTQYYQNTLVKLRSAENDHLKMQYYQQGKNHLAAGENEMAIEVFTKLMELDSNFRDVVSLRDRAYSQLDEKSREEHFYALYAEGLEHLRKEEWLQATVVFEEAKHINPGDTLLLQKLAEAELKLKEATMANAVMQQEVNRQQEPASKSNYLWLFGVIAAAIALPTVFVLKSPTRKAAMYFKRGDYQNAALLYETLLLKSPYNTKMHLALATVYLKMDRNDGPAQKIYSMALQQKLDPYIRKEINQKMSSQKTSTLEPGQNLGDVGIWLKNELDNIK